MEIVEVRTEITFIFLLAVAWFSLHKFTNNPFKKLF